MFFSENRGSTNYVARDNGPGCGSDMKVKEDDCVTAANQLGFKGIFWTGSWSWAPPGCHIGHPSDNWKWIYYNRISNGTLGRKIYKSICKEKKIGRCLIKKIIYPSQLNKVHENKGLSL